LSAIVVENLSKVYRIPDKEPGLVGALKALVRPTYKEKVAVDGLSFQIEPGEIVGYIGVNGAGKSTTIKMLTGILEPSGGRVSVLGRDPHRQRVANAREIGVVFGQRTQLWWDLALIESLGLIAKIYEIEPAVYKRRLAEFTETLELGELLRQPVRSMSLGQKMRAELAATLIHDPKVVYLDEPTIGLDVVVKERIRAFIKERNRVAGTTVILTTHDLGDIEELCQRVIMIDAGQKIYDGPLSAIRERFGKYRTITLETAFAAPADLTLPEGVVVEAKEETKLVLRFERTRTTASQVAAAVMSQAEVIDFNLAEPDLESIVKQIYRGALAEDRAEVPR
jgi:ABC-2 type transport system ATP-binding protein